MNLIHTSLFPFITFHFIGSPLDCLVDSVNESSRTVTLRAQRKSVAEALTRGNDLSFLALQPGMLVNAIVNKIASVRVLPSFISISLYVYIYNEHVPLLYMLTLRMDSSSNFLALTTESSILIVYQSSYHRLIVGSLHLTLEVSPSLVSCLWIMPPKASASPVALTWSS